MFFFNFWHFFAMFLEFPIPCRVGMDQNENIFFSLILSLSRPILAWKEAITMFFNFLNFFAIFLEFPIPGRVGMDRNKNIFFSLILSLSRPVLAWKESIWRFLIFLLFFWNSLFQVRLEWFKTRIFFLHSQPLPSRFGLRRSHIDVF